MADLNTALYHVVKEKLISEFGSKLLKFGSKLNLLFAIIKI